MPVSKGPLPSPSACLSRAWTLLDACVEQAVVPLARADPLLSLHWIPSSTTPLSLARPPDSDALHVFLGQGRRALVLQNSLEAAAQLDALDWALPGELASCAPFGPELVALLWRRGGGGFCLALVEARREDYASASLGQMPETQLHARGAEAWAAAEERARRRDLEGGKEGEEAPGLALSASRGLACLVFGKKRTLLLDMSVDEDEEEE
ncbi:hypothetical protein H632_c1035p0 [Helicosporidium sp. ATCC 50920]|nr:hypothetical protein H632_c1035p0 [Helicosporidium sp. ATCC 50920]|eukprot:KDD74848.1 hypothetical protein H632_c1035p0 [Helicosporidium sp. ATCC 50920]